MAPEFGEVRPNARGIARRAWQSVLTAIRQMPLLFACSVVGLLLVGLFDWEVRLSLPATTLQTLPRALAATAEVRLFSVIPTFLNALFLAPVAVAVHRFILLNETTPGLLSLRPSRTRQFIAWMVILQVLSLLIYFLDASATPYMVRAGVSRAISPFPFWTVFVIGIAPALIGLALVIAIGIRVILIFPALAIDAPLSNWRERLQTSWKQARGCFWLIFRAAFLALLPLFLFVLVGEVFFFRHAMSGQPVDRVRDLMQWSAIWPVIVASAVYGPLFTATAAAVASWIYKWVTAFRSDINVA